MLICPGKEEYLSTNHPLAPGYDIRNGRSIYMANMRPVINIENWCTNVETVVRIHFFAHNARSLLKLGSTPHPQLLNPRLTA